MRNEVLGVKPIAGQRYGAAAEPGRAQAYLFINKFTCAREAAAAQLRKVEAAAKLTHVNGRSVLHRLTEYRPPQGIGHAKLSLPQCYRQLHPHDGSGRVGVEGITQLRQAKGGSRRRCKKPLVSCWKLAAPVPLGVLPVGVGEQA